MDSEYQPKRPLILLFEDMSWWATPDFPDITMIDMSVLNASMCPYCMHDLDRSDPNNNKCEDCGIDWDFYDPETIREKLEL